MSTGGSGSSECWEIVERRKKHKNKERFHWTEELHQEFISTVFAVGMDHIDLNSAHLQSLHQTMLMTHAASGEPEVKIESLVAHLQALREFLPRPNKESSNPAESDVGKDSKSNRKREKVKPWNPQDIQQPQAHAQAQAQTQPQTLLQTNSVAVDAADLIPKQIYGVVYDVDSLFLDWLQTASTTHPVPSTKPWSLEGNLLHQFPLSFTDNESSVFKRIKTGDETVERRSHAAAVMPALISSPF
jgi:hypothetical protein